MVVNKGMVLRLNAADPVYVLCHPMCSIFFLIKEYDR